MNGQGLADDRLLSPCVGTCRLDPTSGWCVGCGRTGDELGAWGALDAAAREATWRRLPARLDWLGTRYRLLPWAPQGLADRLEPVLRSTPGSWWTADAALGGPGTTRREPGRVSLLTPAGRFELSLAPGLRAFLLPARVGVRLAFCLHRSRLPEAPEGPLVPAPRIARIDGGDAPGAPDLAALPTDYLAVAGFTPTASLPASLVAD